MISGGKKSRGESPKQRMSNIDGHDLYADEVAVMKFLENAYIAGQEIVPRDAIFVHLRRHQVTGQRVILALKRLAARRYLQLIDKETDRVRLRRSLLSKKLPERSIRIVEGVRHILCPPARTVGFGFDAAPKDFIIETVKPQKVAH